jgi:chorismate mutase
MSVGAHERKGTTVNQVLRTDETATDTLDEAALPEVEVGADDAAAAITALRAQIDEVDAELISIVQRRITLSKQIQAVRMAHTGRRREHSRELTIVNTYVDGLGRGGSQLALTLLELCRGRA